MPLSTLDPQTALIVIDLQTGLLNYPTTAPVPEIAERAGELAAAFRSHGLPVVLVDVAGSPIGRTERGGGGSAIPEEGRRMLPQLAEAVTDLRVTKYTRSPFTGSPLAGQLRDLGVTQVVIAGVSTSSGVESTARDAHALGFHVTVATDAVTDTNPAAHANSVGYIFPGLGETGSTAEIVALLDATRP